MVTLVAPAIALDCMDGLDMAFGLRMRMRVGALEGNIAHGNGCIFTIRAGVPITHPFLMAHDG